MRVRGPIAIVGAQRFAIGVADERGAIDDLGGALPGGLEILRFGQEREPAAEGALVVRVDQRRKARWSSGSSRRRKSGVPSGAVSVRSSAVVTYARAAGSPGVSTRTV